MDAKDLRTDTALGDQSKDVTASYAQTGGAVEPCVQTKTYQDAGSSPMGKAEAASSRPCAVIGPDRIIPPADSYRPSEYPYKPLDYHHPTRNISPRQTFQENMQRIMVPPSYATTKLKEDHSFRLEPDVSPSSNNKLNVSTETKYCDVPYVVNPIVKDLKNFRTSDIGVASTNTVLPRSAPQGWPFVGSQGQSSKPYGASDQYPEYQSCAAPRAMFMTRPHRTVNEVSGLAAEPCYHEANIRFKPYPTPKDRFSRYDYLSNYGNSINAPPLSSHKVMPTNSYPGYSQVPLKYMDTRMGDPAMNPYQRPNPQAAYNNLSFQNPVIHPPYGPIQGNCLQANNYYPCPDTTAKPMASSQLFPYPDYESSRPKPYPMPDGFYINDITRPHLMKNQVMPPNYSMSNMHAMHHHPYYRKDNTQHKNYDHVGHYRNIDPSININSNPLPRFSTQFSNTVPMSPSDLISNNTISVGQPTFQENFGYISHSLSANARGFDPGISRFANDPFRRYEYNNYGPMFRTSSMQSRCEPNPNSNQSSKDKKNIDVRQFLQMWNEGEEENNENNTKDNAGNITSTFASGMGSQAAASNSGNQEQLYVTGIVNVPSEELGKYEHIQKVSKLPENIKGYNSIEILHKFEEVIESSNFNDFKSQPPSVKEFRGPSKNLMQFQGMMEISMPDRPMSPLDVEAKISQSVIHKEVGCNFEIRPCSPPPMLNVENATSVKNIISERAIEKVTNPVIPRLNSQSSAEIGSFINEDQSSTHSRNSMNITSCKMNGPHYPTTDIETTAKANYSLQDLESNSGVCLASLPRLDNDIELSFPEVNQQFINANKVESVIISTPAQDLPLLEVEKNQEGSADEKKLDSCQDIPKHNKHKKQKRNIAESLKTKLEPMIQVIRTDSVIIKNPETNKNFEDSSEKSPKSDLDENLQRDPMNLTFVGSFTNNEIINKDDKNLCDELAIDFSLNSTDRRLDDDQCKISVFSDHKGDYKTRELVDYGHEIVSDSKVDIQGTVMNFNQSLHGDIKIEEYQVENHNKREKSPFPIDADNLEQKSINFEKDLPFVNFKTDSVEYTSNSSDEINEHNDKKTMDTEQDLSELKEQTLLEHPFLTLGATTKAPIEHINKKEVDLEKYACTSEIREVENTYVINSETEESFSSNIDIKELDNSEINKKSENVVDVTVEKNESIQPFFDSNNEHSESDLTHPCAETAKVTEEQLTCSAVLSIEASEETHTNNENNSFEDSIDHTIEEKTVKFDSTGCDEICYEGHSKEENHPEPSTSALNTSETVEILQGSQNIFFEQPLTPMDITPDSSLIHDDPDDCISRDEIVKMDSLDNSISSLEHIDLLNNGVRRESYFNKEMFSPWMRKLILNQGECCMIRIPKSIPSQMECDPVCKFQNINGPKSYSDISKNHNDDVNDVLKKKNINPDSTISNRDDTDIEETNNINQTKINNSEKCSESSSNLNLESCITIKDNSDMISMSIKDQCDMMFQNSNCIKTIVTEDSSTDKTSPLVTETLPINFIAEKEIPTHICSTISNEVRCEKSDSSQNIKEEKTANSLHLKNLFIPSNEETDTQTGDKLMFSGNENGHTSPSDIILSPKRTTSLSIEEDNITRNLNTENSLKLLDDSEDAYCSNKTMILKQEHLENLANDFLSNDNDISPGDMILSPKIKAVPPVSGIIDKEFPKNCLEAIKNEYASDSEESYADNEVDRIKHQYASDSDEIIENDIKYRNTQDQGEQFKSTKVLDVIQSKGVANHYKNQINIIHNETEEFDKLSESESNLENKRASLECNSYPQDKTSDRNRDSPIANLHEVNAEKIDTFPNLIFSTEDVGENSNDVTYGLETQELADINFLSSCSFTTSKSTSLKRSFSDSDLSNFRQQSESETSLLQQSKRRKHINIDNKIHPETITDSLYTGIQSSRRNSLSSICNDSNVSFCIFIDNAGLLPENCSESEKIQCITEIAEDCLSCVQADPIVSGIDSAEIVSFVEEMNEYSNNFPAEDCIEHDDRHHEESWVDDVACVETVVSDDIAEDIIISASTPLSELSNQECEGDASDILNINDHSDKVRYIYGDKMCSNDAQLLETLYRTPQMNVNKKLVIRESQNTDDCIKFYDRDALEKVLSESSSYPEAIYEPESVAFNTSSLYSPGLEVLENDKENIRLDTFSRPQSPFDGREIDFTRNEEFVTNNCAKTQDDTVHSCESSIDNVFSYSQREESPKCVIPSSPEVSSTTTEEKNSSILLKITDLSSTRVSQSSEVLQNKISCKYTETNDYLNNDIRIPARPLITKAAQKYIPPLKETITNLKVKLTLPQHSLLRLKKLKATKDSPTSSINVVNRPNVVNIENVPNVVNIENIPNIVNIENKPNIVKAVRADITKKAKPKFEDVLKSIEETQFQMHKSKKTKKAVPKVVIKKNNKGSHYASTSNNDTTAPDLTGRKWQPWVFLERSHFIDKMALNGKTLAVYNHRNRTYVLSERFKKYKSIASSQFVISKPKLNESSSGRLKYTIRLKHYC